MLKNGISGTACDWTETVPGSAGTGSAEGVPELVDDVEETTPLPYYETNRQVVEGRLR